MMYHKSVIIEGSRGGLCVRVVPQDALAFHLINVLETPTDALLPLPLPDDWASDGNLERLVAERLAYKAV